LRLDLEVQWIENVPSSITLEVRAGERLLAAWTPSEPRVWQTLTLGPWDWPTEEPLVLTARGPAAKQPLGGLFLDRARLHWD
jgi:hypothetical protein